MKSIIMFDLDNSEKHKSDLTFIEEEMKLLGYSDKWIENEIIYLLPEMTFWKEDVTAIQTKKDLFNVAVKVKAIIERVIAVEFTEWDGIPGKPNLIFNREL